MNKIIKQGTKCPSYINEKCQRKFGSHQPCSCPICNVQGKMCRHCSILSDYDVKLPFNLQVIIEKDSIEEL